MTRQILFALLFPLLFGGTGLRAQEFSLGIEKTVPDPLPHLPIYRFCPDGHISLLKNGNQLEMYWAGSTSYRTSGSSLFEMGSTQAVLQPGPKASFENGGAWLNAVFRQDGDALVGFYHAEDQQFEGDPSSKFVAWKSIAQCSSEDNGLHWRNHGQILTSAREKPQQPAWGGCGDFCVVRDTQNGRWLCFYQEHYLYVAMNADRHGKPTTWKKYYHGEFTEPGLGGRSSPLNGLQNHAGGNPSVHFNTFLKKWVMVWGTWSEGSPYPDSVWISTSDDLLTWSSPKVVVEAKGQQRNWYPTILGSSDTIGGQKSLLCYAHFPDKSKSSRRFVVRDITFKESK